MCQKITNFAAVFVAKSTFGFSPEGKKPRHKELDFINIMSNFIN